ncbi:hypothetical protein AMECASPLE_030110 [Ameca splendens]|uniref:Uncharacterized protein n=1 Tax=Ameca splendens TaxID=208324 RepID=A0ABV0XVE7_9TELE
MLLLNICVNVCMNGWMTDCSVNGFGVLGLDKALYKCRPFTISQSSTYFSSASGDCLLCSLASKTFELFFLNSRKMDFHKSATLCFTESRFSEHILDSDAGLPALPAQSSLGKREEVD